MNCVKCKLRNWYYRLLGKLMFPVRSLSGGLYITDQVVATLYNPETGEVLRRIVGPKMHNKWWHEYGLHTIGKLLRYGAAAAGAGKVVQMRLGSQCSDSSFTFITGTEVNTTNSHVMTGTSTKVTFTAEWGASGAISNICQALIRINEYDASGAFDAACYNFGTPFNKPDGVSLKIEWTTSLSSS